MAEYLVAPLLKLIPSVLAQLTIELHRASVAEEELKLLKDLIADIGEFLEEANSRETIHTNLKASMKQARRFIYDSQDAIDDFMRRENCPLEGLLPSIYRQYSYRTFASDAENIKKMVDDYKSTWEKIAAMETRGQSSAYHARSSSTSHQSSSVAFCEETDDELVGIEGPRNQLVQWLTEKNSMSKVIFVHGGQGVGKSSLVRTVLRDKTLKKHFKYYVWIKDLRSYELIKDKVEVLLQANVEMGNLTEKNNQREQVKLEQAFQRMEEDEDLTSNKYRWALVLDDAGKADVIDSLRGRLDSTCPSVLITTRVSSLESRAKELASTSRTSVHSPGTQSGGAPPELPISSRVLRYFKCVFPFFTASLNSPGAQFGGKPPKCYGFHNFKHVSLSTDNSLALFGRKMFNGSIPIAFREVSDRILKKCEGLPLAILATCDLLHTSKDGVSGNSQMVDWEEWNGRLGEELLSNGHRSPLIRRMITLRKDYPRNVHGCLFYLSVFPLGCPIRCSTLMRLWMAERFAMQDGTRPNQRIAEQKLEELVDRNLVQEVEKTSYGRVRTCRVHNLLHEIIIKKSKDDEFAMIVADQKDEWPETVWRLSFNSQMDHGTIFDNEMDSTKDGMRVVKRLRSLLVFNEVNPISMEELLTRVKRLNVLHLEVSSLKSFPRGIRSLIYLRYLNLRGAKIEIIPDGIRNLRFLETLDLKGSCVRELPRAILALKALRHLLVYRSDGSPAADTIPKHGVKVPLQLGVLKSLRKLCLIKLDEVESSKWSTFFHGNGHGLSLLKELGKLQELRRLGISELRNEHMRDLCSSIEKLKHLQALHLIAKSGETLDLSNVEENRVPRLLQRVHLTGCLRTLPNWIGSCNSLTKLVLKARQLNGCPPSQLNRDLLQHLRELPDLKHLELEQAFDASEMMFEAGKFQRLCFLGLDRFDKLASIRVEGGALPALERLSLARCKLLTTVPQVITLPRKLKCLEYHGMPQDFVTAINGNKEVCSRIKVQRKVWIDGHVVEVIRWYRTEQARSLPPPSICKK